MAGLNRRQLEKLRALANSLSNCPECGYPEYPGPPDIRVVWGRPGDTPAEDRPPKYCGTCKHEIPRTVIRWEGKR
jgi:hypothetical protein